MDKIAEDRVRELVNKFGLLKIKDGSAKFDKEFNEIISSLSADEKREAGIILRDEMKKRRSLIRERNDVRDALGVLSQALNMAYIAREFFHKDRSWLSQRLNGNIVNGKPSYFTEDELNTFRSALVNIQNRLSETISNI